jgi:ribosomal protein S8
MTKSISELLLEEILLKMKSANTYYFYKQEDKTVIEDLKRNIGHLIMQLYDTSLEDNFYYLDCPIEVYETTYNLRFNEVCQNFRGTTEVFFLKTELDDLVRQNYEFSKTDLHEFRNYCQNTFYNTSFNAKIEFIRSKLLSFGHIPKISPEIHKIPNYSSYNNGNHIYINYDYDQSLIKKVNNSSTNVGEAVSKPNQLTTNQIVLILQETGFFTHPKIEDTSKVKQAELISLMTGLNQKNIKTNIEKLDKSASKNGANYHKDIDKINKILDDLI